MGDIDTFRRCIGCVNFRDCDTRRKLENISQNIDDIYELDFKCKKFEVETESG